MFEVFTRPTDLRAMRLRIVISISGLILAAVLAGPVHAQQPRPHKAGLVVVHGDGRIITACVAFAEESISGVELLRRSGLDVGLNAYGGLGYGVCAINGEGCLSGQDCFCQCRGSPCAYWVYSHRRDDGSWAVSGVGASGWQVRDGDVDGWVWGDGSSTPPLVSFDQVCPSDEGVPVSPTQVQRTSEVRCTPSSPTPVPPPVAPPALPPSSTFSTATPIAAAETPGHDASPLGYLVFGIVALGLVSWLVLFGMRGRQP